jgi:hypothetical protein
MAPKVYAPDKELVESAFTNWGNNLPSRPGMSNFWSRVSVTRWICDTQWFEKMVSFVHTRGKATDDSVKLFATSEHVELRELEAHGSDLCKRRAARKGALEVLAESATTTRES